MDKSAYTQREMNKELKLKDLAAEEPDSSLENRDDSRLWHLSLGPIEKGELRRIVSFLDEKLDLLSKTQIRTEDEKEWIAAEELDAINSMLHQPLQKISSSGRDENEVALPDKVLTKQIEKSDSFVGVGANTIGEVDREQSVVMELTDEDVILQSSIDTKDDVDLEQSVVMALTDEDVLEAKELNSPDSDGSSATRRIDLSSTAVESDSKVALPLETETKQEEVVIESEKDHAESPHDDNQAESLEIRSHTVRAEELTSPRIVFDKRAQTRVRIQVAVTLQSESNFWTGITRDISSGGLFVATYNILSIGTQIDIAISLNDQEPLLRRKAEVRWLREYREDSELYPGMGMQFLDLSRDDVKRLEKFVTDRDTLLFEE